VRADADKPRMGGVSADPRRNVRSTMLSVVPLGGDDH
jgi:hypothetical protein